VVKQFLRSQTNILSTIYCKAQDFAGVETPDCQFNRTTSTSLVSLKTTIKATRENQSNRRCCTPQDANFTELLPYRSTDNHNKGYTRESTQQREELFQQKRFTISSPIQSSSRVAAMPN